ncbi:hypothetical protein CDAR_390071, partial [Caerostris darwini]
YNLPTPIPTSPVKNRPHPGRRDLKKSKENTDELITFRFNQVNLAGGVSRILM